jgi:hypothetical protein
MVQRAVGEDDREFEQAVGIDGRDGVNGHVLALRVAGL